VKIELPPLRSRPDDLGPLVEHFLARHDRQRRLTVSAAAMRALARYAWPGNIRELENEVQRWVALVEARVEAADLSPAIAESPGGVVRSRRPAPASAARPARAGADRPGDDDGPGQPDPGGGLLGLSRFGLQKKLRRLAEGVPLVDEEEL
jgi:DNA-binding NtrC family response regulator